MLKIKSERIQIFRKIYPFIRSSQLLFFALGGFKVFFLILSLMTPFFYMILINDVMIDGKIHFLLWVIIGYMGIYMLQSLGIVLNKITFNKFFIKTNLKLKRAVLFK